MTISRRTALSGIAALPVLAAVPTVAEGMPDAEILALFRRYLDLVDLACADGISDQRLDAIGDQIFEVTTQILGTPAESPLGVVIKLRVADPGGYLRRALAPVDEARDSGLVDASGLAYAVADLERMLGGFDRFLGIVGRAAA